MNLEINEEVKSILKSKGISINQGVPFLLSVYFNYMPSYIPEELKKGIYASNIFTLDYNENQAVGKPNIKWNVPLFQGQEGTTFNWIKEYMDIFGEVNSKRRGSRSYVNKRMRELFMKNPDIRQEEVLEAARYYADNIEDPMYIITSHKFISNNEGTPLLDLIHTLREKKSINNGEVVNPFKRII